MIIPITHSIIYHYQKEKKNFLQCKSPEAPEDPYRVLFRFLSGRFFLRVFSETILFESSVIGSSSRSSVKDSSLGSSVLFFRHAAIFYQYVQLLFFVITSRCSVLHYIFKMNFTLKN